MSLPETLAQVTPVMVTGAVLALVSTVVATETVVGPVVRVLVTPSRTTVKASPAAEPGGKYTKQDTVVPLATEQL